MQLEWNRFLEGLALFKQHQGLVWICFVALFTILFAKQKIKGNALWMTALVLGVATVLPVTALVLLKFYTPYYNWLDLQNVFPTVLCMGCLGVYLFEYLKERDIPGVRMGKAAKGCIAAICVAILFVTATTFYGMGEREQADAHGVPVETAKAFEALEEVVSAESMVVVAPSHVLQYVRFFNNNWETLYGRDLWDGKAASYIDSGYDTEYQFYEYLEMLEPELEARDGFAPLVESGKADCIIVRQLWTYWMEAYDGYEVVPLTDSYVGVIKKDLLK